MSTPSFALRATLVATVLLAGMAAWRWHSFHLTRPAVLEGAGAPRALAFAQPGDCPDSRANLERLLLRLHAAGVPVEARPLEGTPVPRGVLERVRWTLSTRAGPPGLHRAILRSGFGATPALLLVDGTGVVRLVHSVAAEASEAELSAAASAFAATHRLLVHTGGTAMAGTEPTAFAGPPELPGEG